MHRLLSPADLRPAVDPAALGFPTTEHVPDHDEPIGQGRATRALDFGIAMRQDGYNVYAIGAPETAKREIVERVVGHAAAERNPPSDWCYVQRFGDEDTPRALRLPVGQGRSLKRDMAQFIDDLRGTLPAVFQQEEFRARSQEITHEFEGHQRADFEAMQKAAEAEGMTMLQTPNGFAFAPVRDGKVLDNDAFQALDEAEKARIARAIDVLNHQLLERVQELPLRQQAHARAQRELAKVFAAQAVQALLAVQRPRYQLYPEVIDFLAAVERDVLEHVPVIVAMESAEGAAARAPGAPTPERFYARYSVNLLVDRTDTTGAPVVYESNPTAENLIGHIEHRAEFGSLVTDFTMIRAGALHRANGGYLIVDAERTLTKPAAWDALKRALFDRRLRIESIGQMLAIGPGLALEPDPIPLDVKVILLGSAQLYYTLADLDPDFPQLFRIAADFAERVPRDDATLAAYAGLIATQARAARLRALDAAAVAAVIDQGIRMAGDRDRISAHTKRLVDLMREADQVAAGEGARNIGAAHVKAALAMQIERLDRLRTEMHERIVQGTVVIDVTGRAIGQVNGLTVLQLGELAFGQPARITATARLGRGQLIDIEREAKLGGNIHSKAVLIVSSFIGHRFGQLHPLAFNASLVFEQSYGGIEGDSASVAEVCALLSAIAGIPLRQDLAITGSMNQHGRVQAIGGANEKIEGFFDICSGHGLTGTQGAVLPADNVRHLMLREDVVAAVAAGRFHVHAIEEIDDALSLLTGLPAGERGADDEYPPDSVNGRVARRLEELWQRARRASASDGDKGSAT